MRQYRAGTARLVTAGQFAKQAEHAKIAAWCLDTDTWRVTKLLPEVCSARLVLPTGFIPLQSTDMASMRQCHE